MTILKNALIILCLAFPLAACDSNDGKAEQLGEKIDDTVDDVKDKVEETCEDATDEDC